MKSKTQVCSVNLGSSDKTNSLQTTNIFHVNIIFLTKAQPSIVKRSIGHTWMQKLMHLDTFFITLEDSKTSSNK